MAVEIYFFKFPNNFSTGGISGISTILGEVVPNISKGTFVSIINYALLGVGLIVFGKGFAVKTVYASMLLSGLTRTQAVMLKDYVKSIEPTAFIIITNSSDILGKGFRENVG